MGLSRRKFTKEMKLAAIQRLEMGSSATEVARAFEVNPNLLHRWRKELRHGPANAFPGEGKRRWDETKVAQLERNVGQQAVEIDFLKGCLQRIEEQRMLQALTGKPPLTNTSAPKSKKAPRLSRSDVEDAARQYDYWHLEGFPVRGSLLGAARELIRTLSALKNSRPPSLRNCSC